MLRAVAVNQVCVHQMYPKSHSDAWNLNVQCEARHLGLKKKKKKKPLSLSLAYTENIAQWLEAQNL